MFGGEVLHCLCLGAVAGAGGISRLLHVMMSLRLASFKRVRNFGENFIGSTGGPNGVTRSRFSAVRPIKAIWPYGLKKKRQSLQQSERTSNARIVNVLPVFANCETSQ